MIYAYEFVCRDFILRTTRKIVGPPDSLSWWSCGPLLKKVCVKPCNTPNPRIFIVLTLAIDDSRAGYNKQKTQKTMFTATRQRGPMEFLTVRQLGANDAIPRPVLNSTLKVFITLAHVRNRK